MKNKKVMIAGTLIVIVIIALVTGIVWAFNQKENVQDGPPQHIGTEK